MRQGVTFDEMADLIEARLVLLTRQHNLSRARHAGAGAWWLGVLEGLVCQSLDAVWEAQQRAA
jgi:hypothetical protein